MLKKPGKEAMFDQAVKLQRNGHETLVAQVTEHLRNLILRGVLFEGERLPPSKDMAAKLNVSYRTMELSLKPLTEAKLIKRTPRGTFVNGYSPAHEASEVKSSTIGVLFHTRAEQQRLYKRKVVAGIQDVLDVNPHKFSLELYNCEELKEQYGSAWLEEFNSRTMDALIVDKEGTYDAVAVRIIENSAVPHVFINCVLGTHQNQALWIAPDFSNGMFKIVQMLLDKGHRRIALLQSHHSYRPNSYMRDGYRVGMELFEVPVAPELMVHSLFSEADITAALDNLLALAKSPTAIACGSDTIAWQVLKYLQTKRIRVPEDIAVTGFNNYDLAEFCTPPLTTVDVPMRQLGQLAARSVLGALNGTRMENGIKLLPVTLIIRQST